MASIERTAYPRFKRIVTQKELDEVYTPRPEEVNFIFSMTRGKSNRFNATQLLKSFQKLGYFPKLNEIPQGIVSHIQESLSLSSEEIIVGYEKPRTMYTHQTLIRKYLGIAPYGKKAQDVAIHAIQESAKVKDDPADLINVAIAELINQYYELPAFSTLDRLARRIRRLVNETFFQQVLDRLSKNEIEQLDVLIQKGSDQFYSDYNRLKQLPKKPRLSHIQEQIDQLHWLLNFGDVGRHLDGIPPTKIQHFAAQAKVLDAQALRDYSAPKRYTLLLSFIHRTQIVTRDHLGTMLMKRMGNLHNSGKAELERLKEKHREKTENLVATLTDVLQTLEDEPQDEQAGRLVKRAVAAKGDIRKLLDDCQAVASYHGNNYLPLILKFFRQYRSKLFQLVESLQFSSTSEETSLMSALDFIMENRYRKSNWLPDEVDLSFASELWKRTLRAREGSGRKIHRRHLEVCVFSYLAKELKSGDICVRDSDEYADYWEQLLSWNECQPMLENYCSEMGFPTNGADFVHQLKSWMFQKTREVDENFPDRQHAVELTEEGEPILKKVKAKKSSAFLEKLERLIGERMPERNIIDILCNVDYWVNWSRHFGPLSGSDPKLSRPKERYILNTFAYGCNLGPAQAARHMRDTITPKTLSFVNQRHVTTHKLYKATKDIINQYDKFDLPQLWGSGNTAAADGTKHDIYENNLLAEYHIRHGGYGGIAYHLVSDNYIALFSHFIPCGVWEAVYIIEGLLKNKSDVQPDTLFADTQGQSTPVFALSYLLGIKLMPRIRKIKNLTFFRPTKDTTYKHIDELFTETINWKIIETHWKDLLRVVLSIKAGKVSSSLLLRKLGNYSRKNRLYQAFQELGRVVRTVFLLQYMTNIDLRQLITATTNKVEAYNGFSKWFQFGGEGIIAHNDPEQMEKAIKYNDLVANAVVFQNVVDLTLVLRSLSYEGYEINNDDIADLSPYITRHIKRFGDYVIDLNSPPEPLDGKLTLKPSG
ncbi:Tn3 family transposase [Salibacterium halotolerans]|uniref:Transposase and inactivated derivatives, TnpA family n=1 Tax=Salibacterium halotolerans TaxID=1884432 RepID=A0A1I5YDT3_9BACI|nr:Tn3 family transposase [Salibacterium halotolerans]SFQ42352.1 Transposase and inactivated derivatives, TnpA family [Salibacterium halotolerans]